MGPIMNTQEFVGKVALVTGAARGIGEAVARQLAATGASVVVADLLETEGEALARDLPGAMFIRLDVGSESEWVQAVDVIVSRHGQIDILVACAGLYRTAPIEATSLDLYERIMRVNQIGVFLGMRAVLPAMRERGGAIVNLSSTSGLRGNQNSIAYGASKWAVRGMSKVAAIEFASHGIRVNSVHPGLIDTPMSRAEMGEERLQAAAAALPLQRAGTAQEVAAVVCFLASDAAAYVTGAEYVVDGGSTSGVMRTRFKTVGDLS